MAERARPELLVIVGPTASGKSELAVKVAQLYGGEIIAADSRTVYKRLDVGTAKPSAEDQKLIPHWGIDLVDSTERFTAADYKSYAQAKIKGIVARGKLAILVGGTGLYIDSVLYDFEFGPDADAIKRAGLENLNMKDLQELVEKSGLDMPANRFNKRHLIRTIERQGVPAGRRTGLRPGTLVVGLMPPDQELKQRIARRAQAMFDGGVIEETARLEKDFPDINLSDIGIVYNLCSEVLKGTLSIEEAIERFTILDWQYARRQKTWFKRNPYINWFSDIDQAAEFTVSRLNT